jgi:hypothetical protein
VIPDSKEGWADSIALLLSDYATQFDYSLIRPVGAALTTGGTSSGPEPLKKAHELVRGILQQADGRQLTSLEVHDIVCIVAEAVVVGGVRRSACIVLFDADDAAMLTCKHGTWWETAPWRARANNSASINRADPQAKAKFDAVYAACIASNSGEPGVFLTDSDDWGTNPCCLSLDSNLLTPKGIKALRDVNEGDLVWSGESWTPVLKKWKTGTKMVYRYETNAGFFLGTADHNVYQNDVKLPVEEAESIDRCLGPVLIATECNPQDVMNGLLIGDGSVHKASNNLIGLYIGDKDSDYHRSEVSSLIKKHRPGICDKFWSVVTDLNPEELVRVETRPIPERYFRGNVNQKIAFLRGIFSANGCVTAGRVQYKTACKIQATQLQSMLSSLGYKTSLVVNKPSTIQHHNGVYTSKESYNLIMYNHSEEFLKNVGFLQNYKMQKPVKNNLERTKTSMIKNIIEVGTEEVYDIMVEDTKHRFWCDGLLVSNCEIALRPKQLCNLSEVNVSACRTFDDLMGAVKAATVLGTLQAAYTDFSYLSPEWKKNCEEEALLGVSLTGMAECWSIISFNKWRLQYLAAYMKSVNEFYAKKIGINAAARIGCVKPSGSASAFLGTSSGIHASHADFYIRRVRVDVSHPIAAYLKGVLPSQFFELDSFNPSNAVISIPMQSKGSISRNKETAIELLERVKFITENWIKGSHRSGVNRHNVSVTVTYRPEEVVKVGDWMWANRHTYSGLSMLPHSDHCYTQSPFEEITEEQYKELMKILPVVDFSKINYKAQEDDRLGEAACAGGNCEWGVK